MKFLDYLQNIAGSEEEFLEIIKEMNEWVKNEKDEGRFIHVPHNLKRFNFSRDEYKKALNIAEKAIRVTETHQHYRTDKNTSDSLLFR